MPRYTVQATITEDWITEVEAEDEEQAKEIACDLEFYSTNHGMTQDFETKGVQFWRRDNPEWAGEFLVYDVTEIEDNDTKGESA